MTLGAVMSFTRAFNDAGVIGGPFYLSTAGPMVQLGTGTETPYRLAVGVSGGAAALTVAATARAMTKVAPYVDASVQAVIPIGAKVSLGVDVRLLAVFADDVLIIGAAPAFVVRAEL